MDTLDVRDLQRELDYLTAARERYTEFIDNAGEVSDKAKNAAAQILDWDMDNEDRFQALTSLLDNLTEDNSPLINEDDFVEYVKELVKDISGLSRKIPGYIEIDWTATAENVKADYSQVDFDGVTYLYRDC